MVAPFCSDEDFIRVWNSLRSPVRVAEHFGVTERGVQKRRRVLEKKTGMFLDVDDPRGNNTNSTLSRTGFRAVEDKIDGPVIVFSDAHYWPGEPSTAHKALLTVIKGIQPVMIVANGDLMDGARLCRQDPIGWSKSQAPTIKKEIEALQERMHEVALAGGKRCKRRRTIGNHDIRLERMLAMKAPDIEGLPHTRLADFLPEWEESWSVMVNNNTMIKHRFRSGVHATWNNALHSGKNMVTGHLHRLQATVLSDYNGPRWGVDTGTLADVTHNNPAFDYDEDNPRNWASGFSVVTFKNGKMLHPEFVVVMDGKAYFRGREV